MKSKSPYHCHYCTMIRMQEGSVGIETHNIIFRVIILAIWICFSYLWCFFILWIAIGVVDILTTNIQIHFNSPSSNGWVCYVAAVLQSSCVLLSAGDCTKLNMQMLTNILTIEMQLFWKWWNIILCLTLIVVPCIL